MMKIHRQLLACLLLLNLGAPWIRAQEGRGQAAPDTIVFNGKIVTVSDKSTTNNMGTIGQAMAIRDGKVVAVGTNAQIRGQAGPNTKQLDLKGRTVLPGLVVTHDHPFDWAHGNPYTQKKVLGGDALVVARYMNGSPQEQAKAFPGVLQEAVSKAKPGQWIHIVVSMGDKYQYMRGNADGDIMDGKMIPRELLNKLSPNNPVVLENPFVSISANDLAVEEAKKVFPYVKDANDISMRWMFHDVVMKDHYPELREIHRLELSWWTGYGVTTFSSGIYAPSNIRLYNDMSLKGDMPMRNGWAWYYRENEIFNDDYTRYASVFMQGLGNDFFWYTGGRGAQSTGGGCTILPVRPESGKAPVRCAYDLGSQNYKMLYAFIKAGGRYTGVHTVGDRDIDNLMDIIMKASKEAGMTEDQIRAKRHTFDHLVMAPRPDQLPLIKRLGIVPGGAVWYYIEEASDRVQAYGEQAAEFMNPKQSMVDAGIPNTFEIDRPLATTSLTVFWTIARTMDRVRPQTGVAYAPDQRIGRESALKMATVWGAYYLMKEDTLGSLEPGKFADFMVLDRDYLTIPEKDIENIRVLETVVGGKVMHLVPSLAKEWGMRPAGAQVELGGPAASW